MLGSHLAVARVGAVLLVGAAGLIAVAPQANAAGETVVSLTFNDGLMSQYDHARPVLRAHNMQGTFYVSSKVIEANAPGYMASWHVDALYREGDEVGGLTKDHVDMTDPFTDTAYKVDQACGDRQRLAQLGYDPQSFSYPFAAVNPTAESIVQSCGYLSGRTVGGLSTTTGPYAETIPPADAFRVSTANSPNGPVQLSALQEAVTVAAGNGGGWLPIAFDHVCGPADPSYSSCMASYHPIDATVLSSFLDWLQNGAPAGVEVSRVRDVMGAGPQPPLPPRPTMVSLTFDDGLKSQYGTRPILASHNVHGTYYINSGAVDAQEAGVMPWSQIRDIAADGNDIGGHTLNHIDLTANTSFDFRWREACYDRFRLQTEGFSPSGFAYPFAAFNATAISIIQGCGYQTGRSGGSLLVTGPLYAETVPPPEPYSYKALGTTDNGPITLQWMQAAVNAAAARAGGWIPIIFHEVCYEGTANFDSCMAAYRPVAASVLDQFLDWVDANASRGISVKSVREVMGSPPNVRITAPASGGRTETTPTISGTALPAGGGVTVALYQGSYSIGAPVATYQATQNNGAWSTTVPAPLALGTYTVQARQTGNGLTGHSAPVTFTVVNDATPPAVQITAPPDGSRIPTATPVISGRAGTAAGDIATVTVRIYNGNPPTGAPRQTLTATPDASGAWSVTPAALSQGTFTLQATQSDSAGNVGTSTVVTTVDTAKPVVRITSPVNNAVITTPAGFSVTGTAGTAAGDDPQVTLRVYPGFSPTGTPVRTFTLTSAAGAYGLDITDLPVGNYTLSASQADTAGNVGVSNAVIVRIRSSMTVTSLSPATIGQGAAGRTINVNGSGFTGASVVSFTGTGLTVTSSTLVSSTTIRLTVDAAADAAPGRRTVVVSQPGTFDATCANCLTVNAGPKPTNVVPATVNRGDLLRSVQVNGTGFTGSSQLDFSGNGISYLLPTRTSTRITVLMSVAGNATVGSRDVTVTNPDGGTGRCAGCLAVAP